MHNCVVLIKLCYCSKDNTTDVICKLLKKYNITDSPSRFVLYERDVLSGIRTLLLTFIEFCTFKRFFTLIF